MIDSSHVSNVVEGGSSREVWAYLLGLYFADGSLNRFWRSCWRVTFYLAGDEGELVGRVSSHLRGFGWKPRVSPPRNRNYFTVRVSGSGSPSPFPDKRQFLSNEDGRGWLASEGLDGELGVPFIAGLLDGDGCCRASFHGKGVFGHVDAVWRFDQRNYPFLSEFLVRYVSRLVRGGAVQLKGRVGACDVLILSQGRTALLVRGIARWSFKVTKFLRAAETLRRRVEEVRSKFLVPGEATRRLHVDWSTVVRWCKRGNLRHMRVRSTSSKSNGHRYLIPVEDVERLKRELKKGGGG